MIQLVLCVVIGSAILFGVFLGFRKLSQLIIKRRLEKMMLERKNKNA